MKRYIIISAIAAIFAACARGPNYRRPIVSAPDVFRGGTDIPTTDARSIGDLKWFEVFKDDQLRQLIGIALEENYDLREAVARVSADSYSDHQHNKPAKFQQRLNTTAPCSQSRPDIRQRLSQSSFF